MSSPELRFGGLSGWYIAANAGYHRVIGCWHMGIQVDVSLSSGTAGTDETVNARVYHELVSDVAGILAQALDASMS